MRLAPARRRRYNSAVATRWLKRAAVSFGRRGDSQDVGASTGLALLRRSLLASALWAAGMALVAVVALIRLLEADPVTVAWQVVVTAVLVGVLLYRYSIRQLLPEGELHAPPPDSGWEPDASRVRRAGSLVLGAAMIVGLAWIATRIGADAGIVAGSPAGHAAASLAGALRVGRWEHRHRSRVAFCWHDREPQLFAVASPLVPAR